MRRAHFALSLVLAGLATVLSPLASRVVLAAISVDRPVFVSPTPVVAGSWVTVTGRIQTGPGDPKLIPSAVYLLRLDCFNRVMANLGVMHDDGVNDDAIAGDGVFTLRFKAPTSTGELRVQVSAPFEGMIRRIFSSVAMTTIVKNTPPVANAGPDQTVPVGVTVRLDGSASSDANGSPLSFGWSILSAPIGSQAVLSNSEAVNPTLVADLPGAYTIQLVVNDGTVSSAPDRVVITTTNSPPIANAGPDQTVGVGGAVILNGTASTDADGDPLSFAWSFESIPQGSQVSLVDPSSVGPRLIPDLPGSYVVRLVVNDGHVSSAPDTVVISTLNTAPVANAGSDQSVAVGQTVTLDGSGSSDIDRNSLTFSWSFTTRPGGSAAVLSDVTALNPTFTADVAGTYVAQLIVNDGQVDGVPDSVIITTQNTRPVANAGPDQTIHLGASAQLDGSSSSDVDGDALTFGWSFVSKPAGSAATLSNPAAVQPGFTADAPGAYVLQLIVSDGTLVSNPDTVVISTDNTPPVANAGPDQTPVVSTMVMLDGSASSDADGNALAFAWSFVTRPAGSAAALDDAASARPQFLVDLPGTYVVQLIVNDGTVNSAADTVTISTVNSRPVANAGADQRVASGDSVILDASGSSDADADNLTVRWSFTSRPAGSGAALSDPTAVFPTFVADVEGTYVVQLIVNDGKLDSAPDTVVITAAFANSMSLSVEGPLVGVGHTLAGTVTLAAPAPAGGVIITLSSADPAVATVSPTLVTIPAGSTQASFTVTGVADGSTIISATAAGFSPVSVPIVATSSLISIDSVPTITPNQTLDFAVSITQPAPTGGLTIQFTSSNPAVATVTPSVTVPAGLRVPVANPRITGVSIGAAVITAQAINFAPATRNAVVTIVLSFSPSPLHVFANTSENITLRLASPAPAGGLTVDLAIDQTSIATTPSTVTVPEGQNSVIVPIAGAANGTTTLRATTAGVAETTATIVVETPPIVVGNFIVGEDLQEVVISTVQGTVLGRAAPPVVGVDVTITSSDPTRLLVSADPNAVGSASATLHVNGGVVAIPTFALQALDHSGTVQLTTSAPGYATDTSTVTLTPSGFVIPIQSSFTTNSFASNISFQVSAARLVPGTLAYGANQAVRAGVTAQVNVTSSNTTAGTITVSPLTFGPNVVFVSTAFDPSSAGTTTISVEPPAGFDTPSTLRQVTATVTAPSITVPINSRIGEDLQLSATIALNSAPPSPVDITLTIGSDAIARVSDSATALGTATLTIPAVANTTNRTIVLQGLLQGTTTLTVSAPGYTTNTQTITVDPSGFVIAFATAINTNTFAANTPFAIASTRLNPGTLSRADLQPLRAGLTVPVSVTSSDTGVGVIAVSPLSFGANVLQLNAAFDPSNAGTTTITVDTPAGFDTPAASRQITATVTAPAISVQSNPRVGEDLQQSFAISLSTAPPSAVDIAVAVGNGAIVRVSDNATVLGGTTVTFTGVGNTTVRAIFLQGLQQGTTTLTVSAAGYAASTQTVSVDPSGFIIGAPGTISTNTFASNTPVTIIAARLEPGTLNYNTGNAQFVRAGLTVLVPVTSSDPGVGTITVSPLSFGPNTGSVNTAFDPLTAGTTTITVGTPVGFDTPHNSAQITANVTAPAINVPTSPRIGEDLQQSFPITLSTAPPSPVDITVTISSGTIARVSDVGTILGGATVTFPGVSNTSARTIFLQGMQQGTTTMIVSAPGYATSVQTVTVDPSGFIVFGSTGINTTASAANTNVSVAAVRLDPTTFNGDATTVQAVRAGLTVPVSITSSNPAVGVVTVSPLSFGANVSVLTTAFDPLAAGTTTIAIVTPTGFDTPNALRQITATVNP